MVLQVQMATECSSVSAARTLSVCYTVLHGVTGADGHRTEQCIGSAGRPAAGAVIQCCRVLQMQMATELSNVSAARAVTVCYNVLQVQIATELSSASVQLAGLLLELLHSVTWCYRCRWPQN